MEKISGPLESARWALMSLNQVAKPYTEVPMPRVAMIGHLLWAGT